MCTVAGYNGTKQAAPILIDMMRKLEGMDSGYYTGIATFHKGKIYTAKVVGDLEELLSKTDALTLPGTMGIIHSRTPSSKLPAEGGIVGWAHPFTTERGGAVQTALVMNGCGGIFKGTFSVSEIAERLMAQGYEMKSYHKEAGNTRLSDGGYCHSTDVRCQLADSKIGAGMDAAEALQEVFTEMPGESVGLLLNVTEPNAISFARVVMPMHVGFAEDGVYMATAPLAFIDQTGDYTLLPAMSYGKVFRGGFEVKPFKNPPATVAPITPEVMHTAYEKMLEVLKEPTPFVKTGLSKALAELYPKADCTQRGTVGYQVITELYRQGRLKVETRYIPGQREGLKAPIFYLSIK